MVWAMLQKPATERNCRQGIHARRAILGASGMDFKPTFLADWA
jgi:hypothetical protein